MMPILGISERDGLDQTGMKPTQERRCRTVVETTSNATRESP